MSDKTFTLTDNESGTSTELKSYSGTLGPDVIDVRSLYGQQDKFTFDPGFASTASCESSITYIDGEKGILLYRGYPVEQLAAKSSYIEVCYLLLYGELARSLIPDKEVRLEFAVATKTKEPSVEILPVVNNRRRVKRIRNVAEHVWQAITAGHFFPTPNPISCGSCPFKQQCGRWPA